MLNQVLFFFLLNKSHFLKIKAEGVILVLNPLHILTKNFFSREGYITYLCSACYMFGIRQILVVVTHMDEPNSKNEETLSLFLKMLYRV